RFGDHVGRFSAIAREALHIETSKVITKAVLSIGYVPPIGVLLTRIRNKLIVHNKGSFALTETKCAKISHPVGAGLKQGARHVESKEVCPFDLRVEHTWSSVDRVGPDTGSAEIHSGGRSDAANRKQHGRNPWTKVLRGESFQSDRNRSYHRGSKGIIADRRDDAK